MVKLSQTREKFSTKDPRGFPPYIHTIQRTCENQASRKTNVHKCINHMYTCIYTHTCMYAHSGTQIFVLPKLYPFMSKWLALFVGSQTPAEVAADWTIPIQSRGKGRRIIDDRWEMEADTHLWRRKDSVDGKTWGLMSWSRERNKGRKDAVGGCGAESACSDPAPEWFSEYTREWPFNSKPTFSLVRTHTITRGVHMWKPWLIFCFCLQKLW